MNSRLRLLRVHLLVALGALMAVCAVAQEQPVADPAPAAPAAAAEAAQPPDQNDQEPPGGKHVFGVLPNYRTAQATAEYTPISQGHKLHIAVKDSFDYPLVGLAGAFGALGQIVNQNPSYGQGLAGFARRWGAAYGDQAIGNMMTEGFMPILLHEDPRYFRVGPERGGKWWRTGYALSRIFVTRTDSGGTRVNFSEWAGNAAGTAISNAYEPDQRDARDNVFKLLEACGTDAVSQVLKEFWPDIKQKWFAKHNKNNP